jgi:hypothetical protein
MICLPAFVLLVAEGLIAIRSAWIRYGLVSALLLSCVTALPAYYRQPGIEDWKSTVAYLSQHVRPADTIIVNNPAYRPILEYSFPEFGFVLPTQHVLLGPANRIPAPQSDHIWLLLCHKAPTEQEDVTSLTRRFALRSDRQFVGLQVVEFAPGR